jgi:hypothetical protein
LVLLAVSVSGYGFEQQLTEDSILAPRLTRRFQTPLNPDGSLFSGGDEWLGEEYATSIAYGNVDDDAYEEVGIAKHTNSGVRFYILDDANHGFDELYSGGGDWEEGTYVASIAFGDIDRDRYDEIGLAMHSSSGSRYLILEDAPHGFAELHSGGDDWEADAYATSIAFGDVDDDGRDEVGVTRNASRGVRYWIFDDGDGGFHELLSGFGIDEEWLANSYYTGFTQIAFGNVDDDYHAEVGITASKTWIGARSDVPSYWIFDDAERGFTELHSGGNDWGEATSIAFGNVDSDRRSELGVTRSVNWGAKYFIFDDRTRGFSELHSGAGPGSSPFINTNYSSATSIAFGDVDGDNRDEVGIGGQKRAQAHGDLGIARRASTNERFWIYDVSDFATVRLVIERIIGLDPGSIDPTTKGEPDFYARVWINEQGFGTGSIPDQNDISPDWEFTEQVNFRQQSDASLNIEVWDDDNEFLPPEDDDPIDISLEEGSRNLNLAVDLNPCLVRGDLQGDCNTTLFSEGKSSDRAEIRFRVEVAGGPGPDEPPDLVARGLEVTQAIQDLNNSVRLVAGKRTFVRFHAFSITEDHDTTARLCATRPGSQCRINDWVQPQTPFVKVRTNPNRAVVQDSFLFELPSNLTTGEMSLIAEVNPVTGNGRSPVEEDYTNNTISTSITFEQMPSIELHIVGVGTGSKSSPIYPGSQDYTNLKNYLLSVFPISHLDVVTHTYFHGGNPTCDDVNAKLLYKVAFDLIYGPRLVGPPPFIEPSTPRFVGLTRGLRDGIGCSNGIPSVVAASANSSDHPHSTHELSHAFGQYHAEFCGASKGWYPFGLFEPPDYPYSDGHISPDFSTAGFFGYGASPWAVTWYKVYSPRVFELMSYCPGRWISDYTYERIMSYLQEGLNAQNAHGDVSAQETTTRLLVIGTINPSTDETWLEPLFILPDVPEIKERIPGDFAVVLKGSNGTELARYPFTPGRLTDVNLLSVTEAVPYVERTSTVVLEGPEGVLKTIKASASNPSVTITAPSGGETIAGDTVTVVWEATDPDSDTLTFVVQYSPDNGDTWKTVEPNVTDDSVVIDRANISASSQARFRVWVSDGINTASDETDATFTVPNRAPSATILSPEDGLAITVDQTLALIGDAYDVDDGPMGLEQLQWRSDVDGLLGNGERLTITKLSEGVHTITFQATDSAGAFATDSVKVTVVRDATRLPPIADKLIAGPDFLIFDPALNLITDTISINNRNLDNAIAWQAIASQSWLELSAASGSTPDDIVVRFNDPGLTSGVHVATVTLTNPEVAEDVVTIEAIVVVPIREIYLPVILNEYVYAPDLVIENLIATSDVVTVTIRNAGDAPVPDNAAYEFWVDLYVNPDHKPDYNETCQTMGCQSAVWGITWSGSPYSPSDTAHQALPLEPGETFTLTTRGDYYWWSKEGIDWPLEQGDMVYAQVDSANADTTYGGVQEGNENNNVSEGVSVQSSGAASTSILSPGAKQDLDISKTGLPARP